MTRAGDGVDLFWIPLGAGAHVVKATGRAYEALAALKERRPRCDLYHSALEVTVPDGRFIIEQAPVPDHDGEQRGVVAEGPVGAKWAGRLRIFRYEIRCWRAGVIPDARDAASVEIVTTDALQAQRVLELVRSVPAPVWGRDELHAGEMWNSNSVTSWLLANAGIDAAELRPPANGRAPGWSAGVAVAARSSVCSG